MTPPTGMLVISLAFVLAAMTTLWFLSVVRRDASIADPFWGTGFVLLSGLSLLLLPAALASIRAWLLVAMTTIWGLRLSIYLLWRNRLHGEDRRYRAMRDRHGRHFWWISLVTVFWLQGILLWIVSLPIQAAIIQEVIFQETSDVGIRDSSGRVNALSWLDFMGVALWTLGLYFEAVGDLQMARFQADPANAGRVMDRGLWRYTRHPNYFGDFCVWWGLYLVAASGGAVWTIFSPTLMTILLLRVSGVTLLEKTIANGRPDYAEYQTRTNAFFPGRPRVPVRDRLTP
jgi:steroid 5-alpha reductase family enzyme